MIEITSHRQGAILNHNHGVETANSLKITIEGISETGLPVKVNGKPAAMEGRNFTAEIELTQKYNDVTASVLTPYGVYSQSMTLVWDKSSYRRYASYIDDHSFLFTELTRQRPKRAFDHFYLAALKKIHDETGYQVTLNCFFRNDHDKDGYTLDQMPDIWKPEFEANSDWLKFSFHSYSEFPDRPYLEASAEEFGRDYDLVQNEIIRFAGENAFIAPVVIHWGNIHPAVAAEVIRRGTRCYSAAFRARVMGGPSLSDRMKGGDMNQVQSRSISGVDKASPTDGLKMHYEHPEESGYVMGTHRPYYDPSLGIIFFRGVLCGNLTPMAEVPKKMEHAFNAAAKYGVEAFDFGSHEQYSFPSYPNYIPDHLDRIALTARLFTENGYKPCFFNQGLLGNTAWGD